MSGLTIPFTGTNKKICIHYQPGARGDFLASVLTNHLVKRDHGAIKSPPGFYKIHYNFTQTTIPDDYTIIKIDDNRSIESIMQITFNGFLKNPTDLLDDQFDHFYTRVKDTFWNHRELVDPDIYDYWIDFANLNDILFLQDLYYQFYHQELTSDSLNLIKENISKQVCWRTKPELEQLSWLIDFEIKFNLLHWNKIFSIQEYMLSNNPKSLLTIRNYSKDVFVL